MYFKLLFTVLSVFALSEALKVELLRDDYGKLGTKIDFYDEEYQNGMSTHVETLDGSCKNLQRRWQKRAVSMDLRGTCASVCTEKDCKGTCQVVIPNRGDQKLSDIKMERKISSVQGCFVEGAQKTA